VSNVNQAKVFLVGAGPMNETLVTLRGMEVIQTSDVIVHDRLLDPNLLHSLLQPGGKKPELIDVGKRPGLRGWSQTQIQQLLIDKANQGKRVVRLKGGDPYVFGRGGEEALALVEAGIPFEVVPGVTSAIAVPALAGIPLTHRGLSSCFVVVTGHEDPSKGFQSVDWNALAQIQGTLVILMGRKRIREIVDALLNGGLDIHTPAAMLSHGSSTGSQRLLCPIGELPDRAERENITAPVVTVIGKVVQLGDSLHIDRSLPLNGHKLVVVNTSEGSPGLVEPLVRLGAELTEYPTIQIVPSNSHELNSLFEDLHLWDWVVFRSKRTVSLFFSGIWKLGGDGRTVHSAHLAAIGPTTAEALTEWGLRADLVPGKYTSQHLLEGLLKCDVRGKRVLLPGGDQADPTLAEGLMKAGAAVQRVTLYFARCPKRLAPLPWTTDQVSAFLLTSASGTRNLTQLLDQTSSGARGPLPSICIGPVTAKEAERQGIDVLAMANEYTYEGLVKAVLNQLVSSPPKG